MFFVVDEHRRPYLFHELQDVYAAEPELALATDICGEREQVPRQRSLTAGRAGRGCVLVGRLGREGVGDHPDQSLQAGRGRAARIVTSRAHEGGDGAPPVCLVRRPRSSGDRAPASGAGCAGPNPAGGTSRNTLYQQEPCRGCLPTSTRRDPFLTPICHHDWEDIGRG